MLHIQKTIISGRLRVSAHGGRQVLVVLPRPRTAHGGRHGGGLALPPPTLPLSAPARALD